MSPPQPNATFGKEEGAHWHKLCQNESKKCGRKAALAVTFKAAFFITSIVHKVRLQTSGKHFAATSSWHSSSLCRTEVMTEDAGSQRANTCKMIYAQPREL